MNLQDNMIILYKDKSRKDMFLLKKLEVYGIDDKIENEFVTEQILI